MAEIWRHVLGVSEVKSDDNFFELGGHSLMALQIVSQVCERFPVQLDLSDIFQKPSLSAFAATLHSRLMEAVAEIPDEQAREMLLRNKH